MILNYFCSILRSYGNSQIKSSHLVPFSALMILPQLQSTDSMTYIIIIMCRIFRNLDYNSRNWCLTLFLTALMVPVDILNHKWFLNIVAQPFAYLWSRVN
uniref:Putative ovule protein n=1 Tax=Solanum chacoense TaxID=4108 RepID=A0A0V0HIH7_SOLCH